MGNPNVQFDKSFDYVLCELKPGIRINGKEIKTIDELVYELVDKPKAEEETKRMSKMVKQAFLNSQIRYNTTNRLIK